MSNSSDLYLSEGTCYFGAGQKADSNFIPCGNADLEGPVACCYEYDYCLSSNTCWDPDTVVTYIAGCTDPLFRSDSCPQRIDYPDQQWVALARCDGADIDLWTGCAHHPDKIQIEKENCDCNKTNVLIQNPNGKDSFDEIGRLPNRTSEAITYNPTVVPSPLVTQKSGGGGLSSGAKAGLGVGITILGLLLLAGAAWFFFRRRRQQRANNEKAELGAAAEYGGNEKVELGGGGRETSELGGSTQYSGGTQTSELGDGNLHRGMSTGTAGQKSELSAQREILEMESPNEHHERAVGSTENTTSASSNDGSIQRSRNFY